MAKLTSLCVYPSLTLQCLNFFAKFDKSSASSASSLVMTEGWCSCWWWWWRGCGMWWGDLAPGSSSKAGRRSGGVDKIGRVGEVLDSTDMQLSSMVCTSAFSGPRSPLEESINAGIICRGGTWVKCDWWRLEQLVKSNLDLGRKWEQEWRLERLEIGRVEGVWYGYELYYTTRISDQPQNPPNSVGNWPLVRPNNPTTQRWTSEKVFWHIKHP